jgi:hypothetical protein
LRYQNKLITQRSTNKLPTTVIPYLKSSVTPEPSADKYQQTYRPSEAKREGWVTYTDYENNYSLSYSSNIYQKQNCIDEGFLLAKNSSVEKETALKNAEEIFPMT